MRRLTRFRQIIGVLLILLGIIGILVVRYRSTTPTFAPYPLLLSSWNAYKTKFIVNGRVVNNNQGNITTSEGQGYALLRAVFIDDKDTFDKTWQWTQSNLKRPSDHLFGWQWGKKNDGTDGFLDNGGDNSASDADTDIALSLIFASNRWSDKKYQDAAMPILNDIWNKETVMVLNKRYLTAGNWANGPEIVVNPSYFAPYAWRIFAKVDTSHDWNSLIDPAYSLLQESGQRPLDKNQAAGLPPGWVAIDPATGALAPPDISGYTTDYTFDAMRVPFRIALDYQWFGDKRDLDYLTSFFTHLKEDYDKRGMLALSYGHDGSITNEAENPAMYATSLGYFLLADPGDAKKIYQEKILKLYSTAQGTFRQDIPYYEQNWLWFGTALYNNYLTNLMK